MWDLLRRPFEDCKSYCDVLDPYYYSKTSPGVRRNPPKFDRACWENDLKYDFSLSRPPPSFQSSSSGRMQFTLSRSRSQSRSASVLHEEEEEQQVQFLFYGGSDISTPVSVGKLCSSGYRSDVICTPMRLVSQPPRISHEIPCFFSPRDTPMMSPMSAPIYSPHLFQINEQRWRLRPRHNGRYLK